MPRPVAGPSTFAKKRRMGYNLCETPDIPMRSSTTSIATYAAAILITAAACAPIRPELAREEARLAAPPPPALPRCGAPPPLPAPIPVIATADTNDTADSMKTAADPAPEPEAAATMEPEYDFPMAYNRYVRRYLDIFQRRDRETFRLWLTRAGRYVDMVRKELLRAGLPGDLAWLPLIESGYSLTAYSRARAVGPWQFLRSTARMYGLRVDNFVDERRDPVKSTRAAIRFLKDLYEELGDWRLAVAAYNGGIGRVGRAVRRARTRDFWELVRRRFLKRETRAYVPRLTAAIMIAKSPEKYGFTDIEPLAPLSFETVDIPPWTSLAAVAVAGGIDPATLKDLNRHLRRGITPPDVSSYPVRVPPGTADRVKRNLDRVYATVVTTFRTCTVRPGDTIAKVCRRYRISRTTLLKANNLSSLKLRPGQRLRIPRQRTVYRLSPVPLDELRTAGGANRNLVLHRVRPGESVWSIARRYDVPVALIAAWNNLKDPSRIKAGERLALFLDKGGRELAARATLPQTRFADAEDGRAADNSVANTTYYTVQSGDTLWEIARRFRVTPDNIRRWNGLESDIIHPGTMLVLKTGDIDA